MTEDNNATQLARLNELIVEHSSISKALAMLSSDQRDYWEQQVLGEEARSNLYAEFASAAAIRGDLVFFESMSGVRIMDNPYAIFHYITSEHQIVAPQLYVWSAAKDEVIPGQLRQRPDVLFATRHSPIYMFLLASAGHVVGNSVLPKYFVRQDGQKYLNTWHGIGYKALGRHPNATLGASLSGTNMLQATHVISPCRFMTNTLVDGFSLEGTFTGQLAETGYPRIDTTLQATPQLVEALQDRLGARPGRPNILYAPTWRGDSTSAERQIQQIKQDLIVLSRFDANIIFLGHHIMASRLRDQTFEEVILPQPDMNSNELLALADILVTDYSSIFFDFLVTGRPIVHYLHDYRTYKAARGLTLPLEELPGEVAFDTVGLQSNVYAALSGNVPLTRRYRSAQQRFTPYEDGRAAERVSQWFFNDANHVQPIRRLGGKTRVAFWGGLLTEGPALQGFLEELRRRAGSADSQITLIIARSAAKSRGVKKLLRELGNTISVVAREPYEMGMTTAESAARQVPAKERTPEETELYNDIYRRESNRLLGRAVFDESVRYDGLSHFWKHLSRLSEKSSISGT